ncbi:MAG: hypothetical protein GF401_03560 [Chitinivibrionales bacterium]|nr:hypothetical protein [Chitinivibrionales bacterium]
MMTHICVIGNIGAGKTELAKALVKRLCGFAGMFEPDVQGNPYLQDFILKPSEFALRNQLFFLWSALHYINRRSRKDKVVQDFSIIGCPIFAEAMRKQSLLTKRDYEIYEKICTQLFPNIPSPSLYILVRACVETLEQRISKRGRLSENSIPTDYLEILQYLHDSRLESFWIPRLPAPIIKIDTDKFNTFDKNDIDNLVIKINEELEQKG